MTNEYFIGIDLNDRYAMVSYYQKFMSDPETISTAAGSDSFQIPVLMAKRNGMEDWAYGDDANRLAKNNEAVCVDALPSRALAQEEIVVGDERYEAEEILAIFLRKLVALPQMLKKASTRCKLVVSVAKVSDRHTDLFYRILPKIGIKEKNFTLIDHKSSFYYFALNQPDALWAHDVYLFECSGKAVRYVTLHRDMHTKPQLVQIQDSRRFALGDRPDVDFTSLLHDACDGKSISTFYLVGDGFDGSWMNYSLKYMCRGHRAFVGKNLYSKGACYAAIIYADEKKWPFIYLGENEMKFSLGLKICRKGKIEMFDLVSAGKKWYHKRTECEVILPGGSELELWKKVPAAKEPEIETVELTDLPVRPERTTRLHILAYPVSDTRVDLEIKDLGFGEFFRSSGKTWHDTISL